MLSGCVCCSGHLEVVKLLVGCSADVSCRDKQGFTPLHAAALGGHTDVVKYLLKHGAEVRDHMLVLDLCFLLVYVSCFHLVIVLSHGRRSPNG